MELIVAVDYNQLRTMASEAVDPIDWLHLLPYTGQFPLSSTYCTVQCGLQITRLTATSEDRSNARPAQRTACAETQGMKIVTTNFLSYPYI